MADTTYNLWFLVEGHEDTIEIIVPSTLSIGGLKDVIYGHVRHTNFLASELILKKVCAISWAPCRH